MSESHIKPTDLGLVNLPVKNKTSLNTLNDHIGYISEHPIVFYYVRDSHII